MLAARNAKTQSIKFVMRIIHVLFSTHFVVKSICQRIFIPAVQHASLDTIRNTCSSIHGGPKIGTIFVRLNFTKY